MVAAAPVGAVGRLEVVGDLAVEAVVGAVELAGDPAVDAVVGAVELAEAVAAIRRDLDKSFASVDAMASIVLPNAGTVSANKFS